MLLDHLEPRSVFYYFEQIAAIPHGSGNTKAISDYCVAFARERALEHYQDALNNVIIIAPAAPGYEDAPAVILQGHLDMVCAAEPGCGRDMAREGLDLFVEGDAVGARGTTLGGDDGIAVAMMLALLDDATLPRPRIEAVFTVDEETGMFGAQGLDVTPLRGRTMLNLDSEEEGVFTVSCAGGARVRLNWTPERESVAAQPLRVTVDGLRGGHSGVEIDKGRGNANVLMGRLLNALRAAAPLRLISAQGGTADNAIPSACSALLCAAPGDAMALLDAADRQCEIFRRELSLTDPDVRVRAELGQSAVFEALGETDTQRLLDALTLLPSGVQHMSFALPGLVETSLNLGMFSLTEDGAAMTFSVRSSVASRKQALIEHLRCCARVTGAACTVSGDYPAWEYRADSPLRERMVAIYRAQYGAEPQVVAIHAGLECGLLAEKLQGLDCVSIGPRMSGIHTPSERLYISSVERTWTFVKQILKESR